jgi:hypothetical protein
MLSSLAEPLLDILLSPALWLGGSLAIVVGLLFHLWWGGGWRQLGRDVGASLVGFGVGQMVGWFSGLAWLQLGQLHLAWGLAGALGGLTLGRLAGLRLRGSRTRR